jgi:membrane-bound lytic murein transglycosylase A
MGLPVRCILVRGVTVAALLAAASSVSAAERVLRLPGAQVEPLQYSALNGWADDDHLAAFLSFINSCKSIVRGGKALREARPINAALAEICSRAMAIHAKGALDRNQARIFFETNFNPTRIVPAGEPDGFYTGYYETVVEGSRKPSGEYNVPVYRPPAVVSAYDRTQIEEGALAGKGLEICWLKNPVDAFFAQIQGSARVKLAGGGTMRIGYAARNGLPYTPVGKFLIERGAVSKEDMSMEKIRAYMEANPAEGRELRRKNRSFVFFHEMPLSDAEHSTGGQGVQLTPLRSIAVDHNIHSYGTPVWIEANLPIASEKPVTPFRHLVVAQDTGTAIVGPARADIFFGSGEETGTVAGRIKQNGKFVMLVPAGMTLSGAAAAVPVPKNRPKT